MNWWGISMTTELEYWKAVLAGLRGPKVPIIPFVPEQLLPPTRILEVDSAWKGIESILADLIERFRLRTNRCLEFGVEFGYSTAALSAFFDSVTGVDTFVGDKHTTNKKDVYDETVRRLSPFENVRLIRSDYRDWIRADTGSYDLIHVDIVHTYSDTFACGLWSASHSQCVIFHDTESFSTVRRAVIDVARISGKHFYNFKGSHGLGIVI
jgi:Methyltransferase domain